MFEILILMPHSIGSQNVGVGMRSSEISIRQPLPPDETTFEDVTDTSQTFAAGQKLRATTHGQDEILKRGGLGLENTRIKSCTQCRLHKVTLSSTIVGWI